MKRSFFFVVVVLSSLIVYQECSACALLQQQIEQYKTIKTKAEQDKAAAWLVYVDDCMLDKGEHNICMYNPPGIQMSYIKSKDTEPVAQCELISCMDMETLIAVSVAAGLVVPPVTVLGPGTIATLVTFFGLENLNPLKSKKITNKCNQQCLLWHANVKIIEDSQAQIDNLQKNAESICSSNCIGLTFEAYKECECKRRGGVWSWDTTKNPPDCVPCKHKEGVSNEYQKCLCENVQEKLWYAKDNTCISTLCSGIPSGTELDKCVCEKENKSKWDPKTNTCSKLVGSGVGNDNYASNGGSSLNTGGQENTSSLGGMDNEAGSGLSSLDSGFGLSSLGSVLGKDDKYNKAGSNKIKKSKSGSWYDDLISALGFSGKNTASNYEDDYEEYGTKKIDSNNKQGISKPAQKPTDIASSSGDDIFAQITKTLYKNYRSATIGAPSANGAGSL
ncbi:MAG TPA: hypothetical protein PK443_01775 [bacterium]|nr:hypothetical protein [bacterium]